MKATARKKWKLVRLVLTIAVVLSLGAAPRAAADPRGFKTEGDCTESVVQVVVDAAKAQARVPEGFVVQEVGGRARVTVFAEDCVMSIDGHAQFATTLSGTGVVLSSPSGTYGFTWNSDAGEYFGAYRRLGIGSLIPKSDYEATQVTPRTVHSEASIPGDFSLSFDASDVTSPNDLDNALESVHWGYGRFGAVKGTYPHDLRSVGEGVGVLQAEPGSPLAEIIGTDPVQAPGLFLRFHFTGTVQLADL